MKKKGVIIGLLCLLLVGVVYAVAGGVVPHPTPQPKAGGVVPHPTPQPNPHSAPPPVVDVPGKGEMVIVDGAAISVAQLVEERAVLQEQLVEARKNKGSKLSACITSCRDQCRNEVNGRDDTYQAHIAYYDNLLGGVQ